MFKKTITFEDFNGEQQSRDFYFHMSKAELLEMAAGANDFDTRVKNIIETKDGAQILHEFRAIIKMSVGVRSEDGQRFIKDADAQSSLLDSPAFDVLLMELATETDAAVEFIKQLIPEKMQKEMLAKMQAAETAQNIIQKTDMFAEPVDNRPAYQREHRLPTEVEMQAMSKEEMAQAFTYLQSKGK